MYVKNSLKRRKTVNNQSINSPIHFILKEYLYIAIMAIFFPTFTENMDTSNISYLYQNVVHEFPISSVN
jgi:hypothetical protein